MTSARSGAAVVSVQRDGPGAPGEIRERLFEAIPAQARADGADLDVGLAIANQIVRQHGGRISVDSPEGRGTRVSVRLPAADDGDPLRQSESAASASRGDAS